MKLSVDHNIFVSKKPFSLIGTKIINEKIYFNDLTADLRYFNDPLRTLRSIFNDQFNEINSSSFNFFRKLS